MIPIKKREYLNSEIFKIVDLIKTSEREPFQKVEYVFEDDNVVDWSDKFVGINSTQTKDIKGATQSISICDDKTCRELDEESYKQFLKFVKNVYKDVNINSLVSLDFIEEYTLNFIIDAHKCCISQNYSDYLIEKINNSIGEYKIYLSILNLSVFKSFMIGQVEFNKLDSNFFDRHKKEDDSNSNELFQKKYKGKLFASYVVKSEKEKAKEIAFRECSLALDILKICFDTLDSPQYKISFDIDSRITENQSSELIIDNILRKEELSISMSRIPNYHEIGFEQWDRILKRNINIFNDFLNELTNEHSELEKLILNSIKRFSRALTTTNLHQRIVEIFTILESLLVLDSNSAILENLTKYCSKLIFKKPEHRLDVIDLLKKMYIIRSQYVHHAIERDFEIDHLRKLQIVLHSLLCVLIGLRAKHSTKQSILKEIDEAILRAY